MAWPMAPARPRLTALRSDTRRLPAPMVASSVRLILPSGTAIIPVTLKYTNMIVKVPTKVAGLELLAAENMRAVNAFLGICGVKALAKKRQPYQVLVVIMVLHHVPIVQARLNIANIFMVM